jgi:hypothetical protein
VAQAFLGQSCVALARPGEPLRDAQTDNAAQGWGQLLAWLTEAGPTAGRRRRRPHVRLWVSGALARPWLVPPVAGMQHRREAYEVAQSLVADATGLDTPCVLWLAAWTAGRRCAAVAMEQPTLEVIESAARQSGVHVDGIRPWWSAALEQALRSRDHPLQLPTAHTPDSLQWLAVDDLESVTVLGGPPGEIVYANTYMPGMDSAALGATLARLRVSYSLDEGSALLARLRWQAQGVAASPPVQAEPAFGMDWSLLS